VERKPVPADADPERVARIVAKARDFVDEKVHGAAPAPYRALELIQGATHWDAPRGFEEENMALGDLVRSPQCKASLHAFDLVNRYARRPAGMPEAAPLPVRKVGIVGAGLMASQLAGLFLGRLEVPVVMKDVSRELVERGLAAVRRGLRSRVERGKLAESAARRLNGLLKGTLEYGDFADCDFVLEAVFEKLEVKKQVFSELEAVVRPDCLLATNTSALGVSDIASGLKYPRRVLGFHFFNPVEALPLVEIARAEHTGDLALATAFTIAKSLGKTGLLVSDSPGYLVNRILMKIMADCMEIVDEGGGFRQVDEALLALGLPMAPFELLGLVGPPVAWHVAETLNRAFGAERFPLSPNFKRLVEAKIPAIYAPPPGAPAAEPDAPSPVAPEVDALWLRRGAREFSPDEVRERVLGNLAREIDLVLREKVVSSPRDVDLATILGAGWPFFMGGAALYLDLAGVTPRVLGKVFFES
jgi:3-hydroxyacyl-CoA dehydrogenase